MITTRFLPLALILGSLIPIQAQHKVIYNFGANGDPSCPSHETISQSPGGNLVSTNHSGRHEAKFPFQGQAGRGQIRKDLSLFGSRTSIGSVSRFSGGGFNVIRSPRQRLADALLRHVEPPIFSTQSPSAKLSFARFNSRPVHQK